MRLLTALAIVLFYGASVLAQEELESHKHFDVVDLNELVFIYFQTDIDRRKTDAESVVDHRVAITSADLSSFEHDLIAWSLGTSVRFEFVHATLSLPSTHNYIWSIEWRLLPAEGASTGMPYSMRAHLTGKGHLIRPKAYLWSAYPLPDEPSIRCSLSVADCRVESDKVKLHGDEIQQRAMKALSEFTTSQLSKTAVPNRSKAAPAWRFHSQQLIEGFPDDLRIWRVNVVDDSLTDGATRVNEVRRFSIWVTEDGQVGHLSIGAASLGHTFGCSP